jgi:inner membrane protein
MGEAFAGRTVGKKAMLWGILAQSIPDIDFLASFWMNTADNLLAHRGFTHSILFALLVSPLFALMAEKLHRPHNISFRRWLAFLGSLVLVHIFLDAFNNYGVGWFEPFSHYRIAFNVIYVADPFFSVFPGIALVMLLVLRKKSKARRYWWIMGLGCCFVYLGYCSINKLYIKHKAKQVFAQQKITYSNFLTTPAPLQNWLWFVAAATDSGYYTGYISVFDDPKNVRLYFFPQRKQLLAAVKNKEEVAKLIRFSQQFYTVEKRGDSIVFNDLRFGQVTGWHNPKEGFAFYYYLQPEVDNTLVVQRGRFAKWNAASFQSFIRRIKGN